MGRLFAGGGFIGLEMVENFVHLGLETCVVEMLPQVGACTVLGCAGQAFVALQNLG